MHAYGGLLKLSQIAAKISEELYEPAYSYSLIVISGVDRNPADVIWTLHSSMISEGAPWILSLLIPI